MSGGAKMTSRDEEASGCDSREFLRLLLTLAEEKKEKKKPCPPRHFRVAADLGSAPAQETRPTTLQARPGESD